MPGKIISANCPCGYETVLHPGSSEMTHKLYGMAYSEQDYEVGTYKEKTIRKKQLIRISDPFLDDIDETETVAQMTQRKFYQSLFDWARQKDLETIKCPRCKKIRLQLTEVGSWD